MPDGIRWVGLDVHARESTLAVFDQGTGEVVTRRVVGRPHELLPWLRGVERPARMVYEAGPTGYGLARRARAWGIEVGVCAPGKTERPPADRLKTDKRDAIRLARLLGGHPGRSDACAASVGALPVASGRQRPGHRSPSASRPPCYHQPQGCKRLESESAAQASEPWSDRRPLSRS